MLLLVPCIDCIYAIRQFSLFFAKIELPTTAERLNAAYTRYIECEKEVREFDLNRSEKLMSDFDRAVTTLFADAFSNIDRIVYEGDHIPKHGPGATADRIKGNLKYDFKAWPERLEEYFPSWEFIIPSPRFISDLDHVDFLEPGYEIPVRVISVPKTQKTPRIIAIEPTAMQYAQQSILAVICDQVARDDILDTLVGFTDQDPNRLMALEGSCEGSLATLDLKEASDRVSNQLVRRLLFRFPHFSEAIQASRSRKADVPGYGVVRLAKFASMGSATCFPIEAFCFLAASFIGIARSLNKPLTRSLVKEHLGRVRVFGDDIVVPAEHAAMVTDVLHEFGFIVNVRKSYWNGKFRESCGKDYYDGEDVTPVRCRRLLPSSPQHVEEIISSVSLRNQLYQLGLWKTTKLIDRIVEPLLGGNFPIIEPTSPVLGRESVSFQPMAERIDPDLHTPLVRGYVVATNLPSSKIDGGPALLKFFTVGSAYDGHLERAGRPHAVKLKLRWTTPF